MANVNQASGPNLMLLWADLNKHGQNQNYENALKVVNKLLNGIPSDPKAIHCKVVCLLHLNKFGDALHVIKKATNIDIDLRFEKAYCEYRVNRTKDALETLQSVENPTLKVKELLAQVLYRLEENQQCFDVYRNLIKNSADDFEDERETNLAAVVVALQQESQDSNPTSGAIREDTYELCYNSACQLLARGMYKEAESKLKEAEALCRSTLEDDADITEDEIQSELGVIKVQRGFALQMMNQNDEALKLYNQVIKLRPSDVGLAAVASNNIVTCNKDQNVFDSKKKIKVATADGLQHKLTAAQHRTISINQCLLYMYMNQGEQCRRLADSLQSKYPGNDIPRLIHAAQLCHDKQMQKAIDLLKKAVGQSNDVSLKTKLVLSQLYLMQGHVYNACDILKSLGPSSHRPGIVSSLICLYLHQQDTDAAVATVTNAVQWYKENEPNSPDLAILVQAAADLHLKHGNPEDATKMLEEVRRKNPHDTKTLAQLISAYSLFDPKKAHAISKELPSVTDASADIDVDALETAVSSLGVRYVKKVASKAEMSPRAPKSPDERARNDELIQKKKKKKKKLPKNYNPDAVVDAERWLPRRERSYFRGKRKDKRKDIGKGTQGSSAVSAESEMSSAKPSTASSPSASDVGSPRPQSTSSGPRQQKPMASIKKKKKGKGNKW